MGRCLAGPESPCRLRPFVLRKTLVLAQIEASGLRRSCPSTAMNCSNKTTAVRSLRRSLPATADPCLSHTDKAVSDGHSCLPLRHWVEVVAYRFTSIYSGNTASGLTD
jgi:hypothetical protein